VGEGVAAVIALAGKRTVPIRAFGQPEVHGVIAKGDWAVFDELVVAHEANLGDRAHGIGFDGEDLRAAGVDPGAALQADGVGLGANAIDEHGTLAVGALLEMNQPGGLVAPDSAALAGVLIFFLVIRMENERQGGKTVGADTTGELLGGNGPVAVFLNI